MVRISRIASALALAALFCAAASAQAPTVSDTFEGAGGTVPDLGGWAFSAPVPSPAGVGWRVDGIDGPVGPGPGGAAFAGLSSLNYNDNVDFDNGAANSGNATSPLLNVVGTPITVAWRCNFDGETSSSFDQRFMEIVDPSTGLVTVGGSFQVFTTAPAPRTCSAAGTWHLHTIDVTAAVGALTSFQVRFRFNSVDGAINGGDGWFVDNLVVSNVCVDTTPPPAVTLLLPPDTSTVVSPPGVLLDWTDSVDTSTCGPAGIARYDVFLELATNPPTVLIGSPVVSDFTTGVLVPGTYFWFVRAVDNGGNSTDSVIFSFIVEAPLPPTADTLFVNESDQGAQNGEGGSPNPIVDETPVFSAIYRDGNTVDSAVSLRFQVFDPLGVIVFDSGTVPLAPALPKDSRTQDLNINVNLDRDTVYSWSIQFTDASGLTGVFSPAQFFRIGDDFDFGVRPGSSNHSRRCFVASASWGSDAPQIASLVSFRSGVLEASAAGSAFTRAYAGSGPGMSTLAAGRARPVARGVLAPLAAASASPWSTGAAALAVLLAFAALAFRRL